MGELPAAEGPADLLDRLPGLYREGTGAFLPILEAAAWTLSRLSAGLRAHRPATGGWAGGQDARERSGTSKGLLEFLCRDGAPPEVLCGMAVRPCGGDDGLEMLRSEVPSVVLLWPGGTDSARSDPARIPEALAPPGVKLFAVALKGPPPLHGISGERFRGEVLT